MTAFNETALRCSSEGWTHSLEDYLMALERAGLKLEALREPWPSDGAPGYDKWRKITTVPDGSFGQRVGHTERTQSPRQGFAAVSLHPLRHIVGVCGTTGSTVGQPGAVIAALPWPTLFIGQCRICEGSPKCERRDADVGAEMVTQIGGGSHARPFGDALDGDGGGFEEVLGEEQPLT